MPAELSRAPGAVPPVNDEATRRAEVQATMLAFASGHGLGSTVDPEDTYLLMDAIRCYIGGADAGAIFVAHAVCERDLAAVLHHSGAAPNGSIRWGLGALIKYFDEAGELPSELISDLTALNDHRKALYHFGHSQSSTALMARTYELIDEVGSGPLRDTFRERSGFDGGNKDILRFAMDQALRDMALSGLAAALRLRTHVAGG